MIFEKLSIGKTVLQYFEIDHHDREQEFLNNGGKFIVPCSQFKIIGKQ
jgi:hypothetical protein